jgi:hypothetical protein
VAEFNYRPAPCRQDYLVVLRKQLVIEKGGRQVGEETRYLFFITNQWTWERAEVVDFANDRCNQENLIEQLQSGVRALRAPVNTLAANGAYMVIAALAWNLKVWLALLQPRPVDRQGLLTMEFTKFLAEVVLLPCQVVRAGGRLVYRLLRWNLWVDVLCRVEEMLRRLRFFRVKQAISRSGCLDPWGAKPRKGDNHGDAIRSCFAISWVVRAHGSRVTDVQIRTRSVSQSGSSTSLC